MRKFYAIMGAIYSNFGPNAEFRDYILQAAILLANVNSSSCSLYVIDGPSVCRLSSVTFVHPTQAIEIFGNISTPCGTLAIRDICVKILRRSSQGNPSVGGVHKRGSRI